MAFVTYILLAGVVLGNQNRLVSLVNLINQLLNVNQTLIIIIMFANLRILLSDLSY